MRTDTDRFDWLEEECKLFDLSIGQEEFSKRIVLWSDEFFERYDRATVREVIDAAMDDTYDKLLRGSKPCGK